MRLLCDAMLGRLARDLRLLGYDTAYASPTQSDDEVLAQARAEGRVLLTRDRALGARADVPTLCLASDDELAEAAAKLALRPRREDLLSRCTDCNGRLVPGERRPEDEVPAHVERVARCADCGHLYWSGSHVSGILARLERFIHHP